jgi:hypothetical protein
LRLLTIRFSSCRNLNLRRHLNRTQKKIEGTALGSNFFLSESNPALKLSALKCLPHTAKFSIRECLFWGLKPFHSCIALIHSYFFLLSNGNLWKVFFPKNIPFSVNRVTAINYAPLRHDCNWERIPFF